MGLKVCVGFLDVYYEQGMSRAIRVIDTDYGRIEDLQEIQAGDHLVILGDDRRALFSGIVAPVQSTQDDNELWVQQGERVDIWRFYFRDHLRAVLIKNPNIKKGT